MTLRARHRLGKYRIIRKLAEGGFAVIWRAHDTVEGVDVALKVPHEHLVTPSLLADFKREVRVTAGLDHPNVLPIKNAQMIEGRFVIAYPLGQGTLGDRMQRRMSDATRVELAAQILEAVAHAHGQGVIHCDLKPDNFILFPGNRLRLTDFGISKLAHKTVMASGSGTLGYLAPEQAMGKPSVRSDVFAVGLILYELFARVVPEWPFKWPPPGERELRRRLHADFVALVRRALEVDPRRRFADCAAFLAAFRKLEGGRRLLASGRRRRGPSRSTSRDWRQLRHREFLRRYRRELQLTGACRRCQGPIAESMRACPWCGAERATWRGTTRRPLRCPRCRRGRAPDWRFCPWCWGAGFEDVSERSYPDRTLTARCRNPDCSRGELAPFMRYCPWCRRRAEPWRLSGAKDRCERCSWGVHPEFWSFCPWCSKAVPHHSRKT